MAGEWTIQMEKQLSLMKPPEITKLERNRPRRMYIPAATVYQDKEYYDDFWPGRVPLGPQFADGYYEMKEACLLHLLWRKALPNKLEYYLDALTNVADELLGAYDGLDPKWQDDSANFLKMMLLDACFVFEFMLTIKPCKEDRGLEPNFYPEMLRIVENHDEMKCYLHDIFLLRNQLPIKLFVTLYPGVTEDPVQFITEMIETSITIQCLPGVIVSRDAITSDHPLNILDVYRRCLVNYKFQRKPKPKPSQKKE